MDIFVSNLYIAPTYSVDLKESLDKYKVVKEQKIIYG